MTLLLKFGIGNKQEKVYWMKPFDQFPHRVSYQGCKYEYVMYTPGQGNIFYELNFAEVPPYSPDYWLEYESVEEMLRSSYQKGCECGAHHTGFGFDHMRFCPLWEKW